MDERSPECNVSTTTGRRASIEPTKVYDLEEVAELLGTYPRKVRRLIKDGDLPRLTYTTHTRVLGEDLLAFLRSTKSGGAR